MSIIEARAIRDDGWWVVMVPIAGKDRATQGRTLKEAEKMARDLVAIWAEELGDAELAAASVRLVASGSTREAVESVRVAQEAAERSVREARERQRGAVAAMRAEGITMQDIADLMGLSKGRVSQLAKSA